MLSAMNTMAMMALFALLTVAMAAEQAGQVNIFNHIGSLEALNATAPAGSCAGACTAHAMSQCVAAMGGEKVTVIMVADPGTMSGSPERMHYHANMKNIIEYDGNQTMCLTKTIGTLFGEPVLLVASGIGPTAAAMCTMEILLCAENIKEIIYAGTSGWSPQPGGVLNNDDCTTANPSPTVNRIGDVCISPLAVNWVCKKADWEQQCHPKGGKGLCALPEETSGPFADYLYGQCTFSFTGNDVLTLADELVAAGNEAVANNAIHVRNVTVRELETKYWEAMSNGTGVTYNYDPEAPPVINHYYNCMEIDGQFFYSGAPWEMTARHYVADVINAAGLPNAQKVTPKDVIAVSAMEAIGMGEAMERWAKTSGARPIPYVNIRGMSNQLHHPVAKDADGNWVTGLEIPEDFASGYAYAITTESTVTLTMLSKRCKAKNGAENELCKFEVSYP